MSVIQDESMEGFDPDSLRIPAASLTNLHPSHTSSQEAINSGAEDSYASPIRGPRRSDYLGAPNEDSGLDWSKRTPNDTVHPDQDIVTPEDGRLPKCKFCGMRKRVTERNQNTKTCLKGQRRRKNKKLQDTAKKQVRIFCAL